MGKTLSALRRMAWGGLYALTDKPSRGESVFTNCLNFKEVLLCIEN